jgi:16S rRNA (cytosine1402-N4)-methyltransferase
METATMGIDMSTSRRKQPDQRSSGAHVPVLADEVVSELARVLPRHSRGWLVDGTVGAGGHAERILNHFEELCVLGLDQDEHAVARARSHLQAFGPRARIERGRMSQLGDLVGSSGIGQPSAVLFDLGVSSLQIDAPERGFSFQSDGPLDMRMDLRRDRTAADIVNHWDESDLADLIFYEGDEPQSRRIARAIVGARARAPFARTLALADLIARTLGGRRSRIHPATRTFQALRRAVNEEGEELLAGLAAATELLREDGLLLVITFHSGEDRVVKRFLLEAARTGRLDLVHKKPIRCSNEERRENPRARSAGLRVARRRRGGCERPAGEEQQP